MEEKPAEIKRFLINKEGGLDIILSIDKDTGNITTEFHDSVNAAPGTIQDRLGEAEDLNLIEETVLSSDHGNSTRYQLTQKGERSSR